MLDFRDCYFGKQRIFLPRYCIKLHVYYFSFLRELLKNVTKGLQARIQLNKMSEEEKVALLKKQTETITTLNKEIKQV